MVNLIYNMVIFVLSAPLNTITFVLSIFKIFTLLFIMLLHFRIFRSWHKITEDIFINTPVTYIRSFMPVFFVVILT